MSAATITLIVTVASSPIWLPILEWIRNRVWAKLTFRGWQALFLDSPENSTYFGIVTSVSRNFIKLKIIYYLTDPGVTPSNVNIAPSPQLTKLGEGQLHAPEDMMVINRDHIIFMENMTTNSPIMRAIIAHQGVDFFKQQNSSLWGKIWKSLTETYLFN